MFADGFGYDVRELASRLPPGQPEATQADSGSGIEANDSPAGGASGEPSHMISAQAVHAALARSCPFRSCHSLAARCATSSWRRMQWLVSARWKSTRA